MKGFERKEMKERSMGRRSRGVLWGAVLCGVLVLTGCGSKGLAGDEAAQPAPSLAVSESVSYDSASTWSGSGGGGMDAGSYQEEGVAVKTEEADVPADSPADGLGAADSSRKLIRTVDMTVETREFEAFMGSLERQVEELSGYIESMETYNGSGYSSGLADRHSSLTIRIPKEKLRDFLNLVSEACNVVRRSENVEDVTLTYVDMESRKEMLSVEQERLLSLLERAESIEDIITIESRLSEVRYQIESMESRLRTFDNQVDYSTVNLNVNEVRELTPVEERSVFERMGDGFADSLKRIGNGAVEAGVWFVSSLPFLFVWAAVIALLAWFAGRMAKRSRKKKGQDQEKQEEKSNHL